MFGADVSRLMEILSTDFQLAPIPSDPMAHVVVQNARELARQWRTGVAKELTGAAKDEPEAK